MTVGSPRRTAEIAEARREATPEKAGGHAGRVPSFDPHPFLLGEESDRLLLAPQW